MEAHQRVLTIHTNSSFYRIDRYKIGDYFGPIDLGLHLWRKNNSFNIGVGLLAGSIFPGSNRLFFTGYSPCWDGFYVSSMGGAGLVFDNLGINTLSIIAKAPTPSILYLNRDRSEEIQVELVPVDLNEVWNSGRKGIYALTDYTYEKFGHKYKTDPRVLVVGPSAQSTDVGAVCSIPIENGKVGVVDTWAGRGGLGSRLLQSHGIAAIIYGGTHLADDFRDRVVADKWFVEKYQKKLASKDFEATTKYRFEPKFETGGTFGVNFTTLKGKMMSFNYKSIYMTEEERLKVHKEFVLNHYLKQFNEETIKPKQQKTCGEPCAALCKKMNGVYKKDYEPYQTMGPLSGIFDQRAAEMLNHHADMYGFDGIGIGGVLAWLMECLDEGYFTPEELGVTKKPVFKVEGFDVIKSSMNNAELGVELLDSIVLKRGIIDFSRGPRLWARKYARLKNNREIKDSFVCVKNTRNGWMVPNQYWAPGLLAPMPIMGKYYLHYGDDFVPPRELGKKNAARFKGELIVDNVGICRFHRGWAEEMIPEIIGSLYNMQKEYVEAIDVATEKIVSRNKAFFWVGRRSTDFVYHFLKRKQEVDKCDHPELAKWIEAFEKDKNEAALSFWYEMHRGMLESFIKP